MKPNKKIVMWILKKLYPAILMEIAHYKLIYVSQPENLLMLDEIMRLMKSVTSVNDSRLVRVPRLDNRFMVDDSVLRLKVLKPNLCAAIKELKRLAKPHCTRVQYFDLIRNLNCLIDFDNYYHRVEVENDDDSPF